MDSYSTLIPGADLRALLASGGRRPLLLDVRHGGGHAAYLEGHLEGAVFVDTDRDLAGPADDPAHGGRHPLPGASQWIDTLTRLGLTPQRQVVAYDAAGGALAAARAWWMLRASGHQRAAVLDGGLDAALAAGLALEPGETAPEPAAEPYPFEGWRWPTSSIDEVAAAAGSGQRTVLDVRSAERYRGEIEPFDPTPGRIPGALGIPYSASFGGDGRMRPALDLTRLYGNLGDRVIIHCGSGITACLTILAMVHAGLEPPSLYVGSWGEWCRSGRAVATGPDTALPERS